MSLSRKPFPIKRKSEVREGNPRTRGPRRRSFPAWFRAHRSTSGLHWHFLSWKAGFLDLMALRPFSPGLARTHQKKRRGFFTVRFQGPSALSSISNSEAPTMLAASAAPAAQLTVHFGCRFVTQCQDTFAFLDLMLSDRLPLRSELTLGASGSY
ncbi:hypothetical protein CB1_001616038 [Camelus ferus]|nr:hypothetical protein CB1_001616038 [Camelus ferus]